MTDWIKYDGTNKPDDGALVRIRHNPDVDLCGEAWESNAYLSPAYWLGWIAHDESGKTLISHFQLKDKQND